MAEVLLDGKPELDDRLLYERGVVIWHTSEEGGGPDVGISVGLGDGSMLYAGDLPDPAGHGLKLYMRKDSVLIASHIDPEAGRDLIERLGVILR